MCRGLLCCLRDFIFTLKYGIFIIIDRSGADDPMEQQVKSKQRVADHGEVFTAEREVQAMCDLVKQETERIDSRFLEPACGDGNFLAEILKRKLAVVTKKYKKSAYDWERNSLLALGSIYGVELLSDNCKSCRNRLYDIWNKEYKKVCKKECNEETRAAARFILNRNIICGNALTYHCVGENGQDTNEPIVFSEWSFPRNDAFIYRRDFDFDSLVNGEKSRKKQRVEQQSLFENLAVQQSLFTDEEVNDDEGRFIQEYKCHYRRLGEDG